MATAFDRGEKVCGMECGGPLKGKVFPRYRGPLTPGVTATKCFVCGEDAKDHVSDPNMTRILGVCGKHFHLVRPTDPEKVKPEDRGIVVTRKVAVPPEDLFGLGKKE
jgi:hypothetical protein